MKGQGSGDLIGGQGHRSRRTFLGSVAVRALAFAGALIGLPDALRATGPYCCTLLYPTGTNCLTGEMCAYKCWSQGYHLLYWTCVRDSITYYCQECMKSDLYASCYEADYSNTLCSCYTVNHS